MTLNFTKLRYTPSACTPHLHRSLRADPGVLPCVWWGVMASQLDLPSLTALSIAGCGRLQLGAQHWGARMSSPQLIRDDVQVVDN